MQSELIPHVDVHNHFLGLVEREVAYRQGLPHRSVHGLVVNNQGQYLLQQRSFDKATWPGKWDLSVGETMRGQETSIEGLQRGVAEELGITAVLHPETLRANYYCEYEWSPYKVYGVITLFRFTYDGAISLKDGEVATTKWLSPEEITTLVRQSPQDCTPWLVADWQWCVLEGLV